MFKPLIFFIGLRYTRAKRRTRFISFITFTSVLGIALGVTALITVLSVMNGFEAELRERILGMTSHASISGLDGQLRNWRSLEPPLEQDSRILGWAPYIEGQAMLNSDRRVSGVMLRGIMTDYEPRVSEVANRIVEGHLEALKPGEFGIILGSELADYLGVLTGDKVTVITPQLTATPAGILPRLKRFTVVGVFQVGMYEYDRNLALIQLEDAAKLFRLDDAISGLRLKLDDVFYAQRVARDLGPKLDGRYQIADWTQSHSNFFKAIQTEKRVMFIILLLIVAVAAFNIVSTLVMVVTDKRSDIAILRTQGMTPLEVMGIFIVLGTVIGTFGTLLGGVGGVLLAWNVETIVPAIERLFGVHFLSADVYYISELPSKLIWSDVYRITGMAFLLSILATIYPAWQASRIKPAEELRYE
ncbi:MULTISPECIES: lipoprotein-releasing ABC transporter permease subunit [Methylocaldum]|jgi:lipoprotein-releasing system permease protein|uniref:lipoprotein-releasing ABC transporter permease subunit n=1 Tax=unclassified Methylocaldum TaxID=2622260 RepID=UPI000989F23C|nr:MULTISPECIES: lipoprotein-releasing ABC transporter permease subunit [unclassified Methylocaldum]MBP1149097.1 lipoprotein-releasing system permease protein [Methylocaldum sp. RMAD-M]MVF20289.1 lipoprotein-releasing ABC transporter permease subunit [Methylocaldum sp. BRCS4]